MNTKWRLFRSRFSLTRSRFLFLWIKCLESVVSFGSHLQCYWPIVMLNEYGRRMQWNRCYNSRLHEFTLVILSTRYLTTRRNNKFLTVRLLQIPDIDDRRPRVAGSSGQDIDFRSSCLIARRVLPSRESAFLLSAGIGLQTVLFSRKFWLINNFNRLRPYWIVDEQEKRKTSVTIFLTFVTHILHPSFIFTDNLERF